MLTHTVIDTPIGPLKLVAREGALCAVGFTDRWDPAQAQLVRRFGGAPSAASALEPIASRFRAYFRGELDALDALRLDVAGTALQERVWAALRALRPGETRSYHALAREVGSPHAVRAVASANAKDPVAIVVPCHRIVRADGTLGGYAGGLERKRWLLAHEAVQPKKASAA